MVQMFALRGINIGVRKTLADAAKDFRMICQRLSLILRKTLAGQMLYHGASSIVPSGIIHCTMRRGAIYHAATKFVADNRVVC